jgi:DNA invertase Pin-like site-specific DNA recombinase
MPNKPKVTVIPSVIRYTHRVGIYCRVSTRSQEQFDSLSNQLSFLTRMVSGKLGWQLTDIYLDVRSGTDAASRSEFQRMLRDCRANKLDIIFTKSISRFGRNTVEMLSGINPRSISD